MIEEANYAQEMREIVLPALSACREDAFTEGFDGKPLHYAHFTAQEEKGVVVICHGFTESCEKFHELTYAFLQKGYSVYIIEHRGHGRSYRKLANQTLTHIDRFENYVRDFTCFMDQVVRTKEKGKPLFLFAHSMGGAIGTLYLEQAPDVFRKAVLSSPMVAPSSGGFPIFLARAIVWLFKLFGQAEKRAFISEEYPGHEEFENSACSSRARFDYYQAMKTTTKELQNYSPTYSWVFESLRVKNLIMKGDPGKIKIPVKLFVGEYDTVVERPPQEELARKLPDCSLEEIRGAKHELYLAPNEILAGYLDSLFRFLDQEP